MEYKKDIFYEMPVVGGAGQLPPTRPGRPGFGEVPGPEGPMWPPGTVVPQVELQAVFKVMGGMPDLAGKEAGWSGTADSRGCQNVSIICDVPKTNGIYVEDSDYEISNARLCLTGDCVNDFAGNGAAVQAMGCSKVELKDSQIVVSGVLRSCLMTDQYAKTRIQDCELVCEGGQVPLDSPALKIMAGPGMVQAPPTMGVSGHSRLALCSGNSHTYFYDCKIFSDAWAALSTDACWGDTYLEANRCDITVAHPGYGTFADEGSLVVLNDCRVKTASHTGMLCGKSKMQLHRCNIESDRHCVLIFSVMGNGSQIGQLTVDSCEIRTSGEMFVVKGTNAYLDIRNSKLKSDIGKIINTDANREDLMATSIVPDEPLYGIKVALSDMEIEGDIIHGDENRAMSISMRHTQIRGAIRGAVIELDRASRWFADKDSYVTICGNFEEAQLDAAEGVTVQASVNGLEKKEISLKSGGLLVINQEE